MYEAWVHVTAFGWAAGSSCCNIYETSANLWRHITGSMDPRWRLDSHFTSAIEQLHQLNQNCRSWRLTTGKHV